MNDFVKPLLEWYNANKRDLPWRLTHDPYCIWISEIMAQQTRIEVVVDYYNRFVLRYPTVKDLAESSEEELLKYWEGLGYYSRARNLHKAAKTILEKYSGSFPNKYEDILSLPGIGVYTAGAICSIAYNQKIAAVDGNVCRVLERYQNDDRLVDDHLKEEYKKKLEEVYPIEAGEFSQAIMELGALICTPKVYKCDECPLQKTCKGYYSKTVDQLPNLSKPKERKQVEMTVFYVTCQNKVALHKREDGLLAGMYEYPNVEKVLSEEEINEMFGTLGAVDIKEEKGARHVFSHVEWQMHLYQIKTTKFNPKWIYVSLEELDKSYPLPTAFRKLKCKKML